MTIVLILIILEYIYMKIALFPQGSCLVLILIILEYIYIKINAQENIRAGVS